VKTQLKFGEQIWITVYLNGEVHSSLCINKKDISHIKNRFIKDISQCGKVKFKLTKREPFYGW